MLLFDGELHGCVRSCSFSRRYAVLNQTTRSPCVIGPLRRAERGRAESGARIHPRPAAPGRTASRHTPRTGHGAAPARHSLVVTPRTSHWRVASGAWSLHSRLGSAGTARSPLVSRRPPLVSSVVFVEMSQSRRTSLPLFFHVAQVPPHRHVSRVASARPRDRLLTGVTRSRSIDRPTQDHAAFP